MSNTTTTKLIDRFSFPPSVAMPNIGGITGEFFDIKLNPHWKEAEAGSYAWFESYGVYSGRKREKFYDTGLSKLASLLYAEADLEHLRPCMDFVLWIFAFDDLLDEGELSDNIHESKLAIEVTMNVLRNPDGAKPTSKLAVSLLDFFNRMRSNSGAGTIRRFVDATETYTQAAFQQTVYRSVDDVPTIREFIELRREASAIKLGIVVLEYSLGLDLPEEVHNDPILAELLVAANDITTWANDIYSFPIEYTRGETQNLVFITMCDKNMDLQGAMNYVEHLIRERTQEYLDAKKRLRSFGPEIDPLVACYVHGLEYVTQGMIQWAYTSPRYFGPDIDHVRDTVMIELIAPA